jgi:hypothetical protein
MRFFTDETFLLLGGCGMVGQQIAHEIARELDPRLVILCGLTEEEVERAVTGFRRDFPKVSVTGAVGDVFIRSEWNPHGRGASRLSRRELLESEEHRAALYEDVFLDREAAYGRSELVRLIRAYAPNVVIDSINTATAFSYQDVYTASDLARRTLDELKSARRGEAAGDNLAELIGSAGEALDAVLISQSVPQLVRHVLFINDAMREAKTRLYLKVGTTGTGGMGLNIPYTHSEDSPSATLMEKTAIAFAHTGLMYLMARTLGGPAVKELKPAAMIGYADLAYQPVRVSGRGKIGVPGQNVKLYASRTETLSAGGQLRLRPREDAGEDYDALGDMNVVVVNTGENGLFTKGEFQAITHMRQMEFITPEEIARQVVLEVKGSSTGYDVIAAIDGASMNPSYRAGYLRHLAIRELERLEEEKSAPSVALGELGPPELGKLLWEAYLLRVACENSLEAVLSKSSAEIADLVSRKVKEDERLRNTIVSVGLPILVPGSGSVLTLIRGPYIRIPEEKNKDAADIRSLADVDAWAAKGWVDLRPDNMERWRRRFATMRHETARVRERGSAAFTRKAYLTDEIEIGTVVGWVFNNEEDFGYRIK